MRGGAAPLTLLAAWPCGDQRERRDRPGCRRHRLCISTMTSLRRAQGSVQGGSENAYVTAPVGTSRRSRSSAARQLSDAFEAKHLHEPRMSAGRSWLSLRGSSADRDWRGALRRRAINVCFAEQRRQQVRRRFVAVLNKSWTARRFPVLRQMRAAFVRRREWAP